ncbi:astacin-like metalloprotease toxin 5 [Folsomia candida]|nr:astacin-like metalloprotease toxin 5 [Folsomia candida]
MISVVIGGSDFLSFKKMGESDWSRNRVRHRLNDAVRFGDMLFPREALRNATRSAVPNDNQLWPGGIIPYEIDKSAAQYTSLFIQATQQFNNFTCVKFVPRGNEENYLGVQTGEGGCYSYVGYWLSGRQEFGIGRGCVDIGTIVHELGHTVGLYHEHDRSDRDDYIVIFWSNVQPGYEDRFEKMLPAQNRLLNGYDTDSIMHYGEAAFSKDGASETMRSKFGHVLRDPSEKHGLDKSDIERINKLYKC